MCMGEGTDPATSKSKEIDRVIKQDEKRMSKEVKLLLLGAGESGKSTILKQMKLIHTRGFTRQDKEQFKVVIFTNMLSSLKAILAAMDEYDLVFDNEDNESYYELIQKDRELAPGEEFPTEYKTPFISVWRDTAVQKAVKKGNEYALHDNITYFFDHIDRLFARQYIPNDQDILRARMKTTGISETIFDLGTLTYRMFDVGGQRSERKKWIHCFQNVNALLFLVAISGYDQCLVEDKDANQMQEALMLFESICNSQWFVNTSIILFLNKIDLFKSKIASSPVNKFFPEYDGDPLDHKAASEFFKGNFVGLNRNPAKEIYTHFTNATDTNLLKVTMASVQDMILQKNLQNLILL